MGALPHAGLAQCTSCPAWLVVMPAPRPALRPPRTRRRWQLLRRVLFSSEWLDLVATHGLWRYVWMPDDDVYASACDVAQLFAMMQAAHLQLAQVREGRAGWDQG